MTCRLFIDEVGNDDSDHESERYLSLTGIITKSAAHDRVFTPEIEQLKADLFGHELPGNPVVLHRREIVRKEPPFDTLWDAEVDAEWQRRFLKLVEDLPYIAITVLIDKIEHKERYRVWRFNPYHYCIQALVERYVLWLNRQNLTGDVMVESRFKDQDKPLKKAFTYTYDHGTDDISPAVIQRRLTSREIKLEDKAANVAGLQFVDLIANPSHQHLKSLVRNEAMKAAFGKKIVEILNKNHYARNPKTGRIQGWGTKLLP